MRIIRLIIPGYITTEVLENDWDCITVELTGNKTIGIGKQLLAVLQSL